MTDMVEWKNSVEVLSPNGNPGTRSVRGVNECGIALHGPGGGDTVKILSPVDNLVNGATGQMIPNRNLMFGLSQTVGIEHVLPLL